MNHKVLLVDDEPNVLKALQRALHKEPYEILTAQTANEALGQIKGKVRHCFRENPGRVCSEKSF